MHLAGQNLNLLKEILGYLSQDQQLEVLSVKDKDNSSILLHAVTNPTLLKELLALFPQPVAQMLLRDKNKYGETLLHQGVMNAESFKLLLNAYPESERFAALTQKDKHQDTEAVKNRALFILIKELLPLRDLKTMLQYRILPTFISDGFNELKSIIIRRIQEQGCRREKIGCAWNDQSTILHVVWTCIKSP